MKAYQDNIIALATPAGSGAIGVIRLSGPDVIEQVNRVFEGKFKQKNLNNLPSHTIHLGYLKDGNDILDEVLVSLFKNPHSYTGENVVEISVHGSTYIQQQILQLFLKNGLRHAKAGEFTLRAFLNEKMDLSQAEAVADLIASDSETSHRLALQQMRGGFSNEINKLREELIHFASLMELELDFAEEDVEFADRKQFSDLIQRIKNTLQNLINSFAIGNVLKEGVPVAIVGEPNVGKSTLLNALLNEERAIVSNIAGTTRDTVEDEIILNGIRFRFMDTAGIRVAQDEIEMIGIRKTYQKIDEAKVIIFLLDACKASQKASCHQSGENIVLEEMEMEVIQKQFPDKKVLAVINKIDLADQLEYTINAKRFKIIEISAKKKKGLNQLKNELISLTQKGQLNQNEIIVSNARHFEALNHALEAIAQVEKGMNAGVSVDLLSIDIRSALHHLGEITGQVHTDDLLDNIFKNFCIGK